MQTTRPSPSTPAAYGAVNGADHETSGDDGTRTHDPLLAKQVLFQLSYVPEWGHHGTSR